MPTIVLRYLKSSHLRFPDITRVPGQPFESSKYFPVAVLRKTFFNPDRGKIRIKQYVCPKDVVALVGMDEPILVAVAGGLFEYLYSQGLLPRQSKYSCTNSDGLSQDYIPVSIFSLDQYMYIEYMSLRALSVFSADRHPSQQCDTMKSKEGFSLAGLLMEHTCSSGGDQLLKTWLLKPTLNPAELTSRYDAINVAILPVNIESVTGIRLDLKHIQNISSVLKRLRMFRSVKLVNDWHAIWQFCHYAIKIRLLVLNVTIKLTNSTEFLLGNLAEWKNIFERIKSGSNEWGDLEKVHKWVQGIIDFKKSAIVGRIVPRDGLDLNLDAWRNIYNSLDLFLSSISDEVALLVNFEQEQVYSGVEMEVEYIPQIGYVIVFLGLKPEHLDSRGNFKPADDAGMEFQFIDASESGISVFYKNHRTHELDLYFGDIRSIVIDMENSLVRQLHEKVASVAGNLCFIGDLLSELDVSLAMAQMSLKHSCTRPALVRKGISITGGRHLLQEVISSSPFIPNDTWFEPDHKCAVQIVSGPNSGGKSIYLKQVGLIVLLAHVGCYVPAEEASICIVDRVFFRIASVESASISQSAFSIDICQMKEVLSNCTRSSLLLIDEFGKGTSDSDGMCLLCATIGFLNHSKAKCIIATHYSEIFGNEVPSFFRTIRHYRMEHRNGHGRIPEKTDVFVECLDKKAGEGLHRAQATKFVSLFKLSLGYKKLAENSSGLVCASASGVSDHFLDRSSSIRSLLTGKHPTLRFGRSPLHSGINLFFTSKDKRLASVFFESYGRQLQAKSLLACLRHVQMARNT